MRWHFADADFGFCYENEVVDLGIERIRWLTRRVKAKRGFFGSVLTVGLSVKVGT